MEEDKGVKVGIVGVEGTGVMKGVVVLDKGGNLHLRAQSVFDDCAKGVGWGAGWKGEFGIAVGHAFRADKYEVEGGAGEEVGELQPDFSRERRFGTGAENEETDRGWVGTEAGDGSSSTRTGRMKGVSEGCRGELVWLKDEKRRKE